MRLDEARRILEDNGYELLNEGKVTNFVIGLALSLGLLSNAQAREFNARAHSDYKSVATTSVFAKDLQKNYNIESNVNITADMVQAIADQASNDLIEKIFETNNFDINNIVKMKEFMQMVKFYKQLKTVDKKLADMFSRRIDRAFTKSLTIAPNIEAYANKVKA